MNESIWNFYFVLHNYPTFAIYSGKKKIMEFSPYTDVSNIHPYEIYMLHNKIISILIHLNFSPSKFKKNVYVYIIIFIK